MRTDRNKSGSLRVRRYDLPMQLDIVCFSHLRWHFVYQRPQHLLSRFARNQRVFYVEEPVVDPGPTRLEVVQDGSSLWRVIPRLTSSLEKTEEIPALQCLVDELFGSYSIQEFILWYYNPMALESTRHLKPRQVIYDCMDELSAFQGAPQRLKDLEAELMTRADLVFTGGQSLYEAKQDLHANIHPFPSSIDFEHFAQARTAKEEPLDQARIPSPRIGYFGVIDERIDIDLLAAVADHNPDWQLVMVGPVVKIDPGSLPQRENIHYLGMKPYGELPAYLAGWDAALLPFALNESTRFISPTKTPEYLAGGKRAISTPILDVIRPYGEKGLVWIAETREEFMRGIEAALEADKQSAEWMKDVDKHLAQNSWDGTWRKMCRLMVNSLQASSATPKTALSKPSPSLPVIPTQT